MALEDRRLLKPNMWPNRNHTQGNTGQFQEDHPLQNLQTALEVVRCRLRTTYLG